MSKRRKSVSLLESPSIQAIREIEIVGQDAKSPLVESKIPGNTSVASQSSDVLQFDHLSLESDYSTEKQRGGYIFADDWLSSFNIINPKRVPRDSLPNNDIAKTGSTGVFTRPISVNEFSHEQVINVIEPDNTSQDAVHTILAPKDAYISQISHIVDLNTGDEVELTVVEPTNPPPVIQHQENKKNIDTMTTKTSSGTSAGSQSSGLRSALKQSSLEHSASKKVDGSSPRPSVKSDKSSPRSSVKSDKSSPRSSEMSQEIKVRSSVQSQTDTVRSSVEPQIDPVRDSILSNPHSVRHSVTPRTTLELSSEVASRHREIPTLEVASDITQPSIYFQAQALATSPPKSLPAQPFQTPLHVSYSTESERFRSSSPEELDREGTTESISKDLFEEFMQSCRNGNSDTKEFLKLCREKPEVMLNVLRKRNGNRSLLSDKYISQIKTTHGSTLGDPKYHYLMVDGSTSVTFLDSQTNLETAQQSGVYDRRVPYLRVASVDSQNAKRKTSALRKETYKSLSNKEQCEKKIPHTTFSSSPIINILSETNAVENEREEKPSKIIFSDTPKIPVALSEKKDEEEKKSSHITTFNDSKKIQVLSETNEVKDENNTEETDEAESIDNEIKGIIYTNYDENHIKTVSMDMLYTAEEEDDVNYDEENRRFSEYKNLGLRQSECDRFVESTPKNTEIDMVSAENLTDKCLQEVDYYDNPHSTKKLPKIIQDDWTVNYKADPEYTRYSDIYNEQANIIPEAHKWDEISDDSDSSEEEKPKPSGAKKQVKIKRLSTDKRKKTHPKK